MATPSIPFHVARSGVPLLVPLPLDPRLNAETCA